MAYQDIDKKIRECKKCGKIKPFEEFTKNKNCLYGIGWNCSKCESLKNKKWRNLNKQHVKAYQEKYMKDNNEKIKILKKTYNTIHREEILIKRKIYRDNNKEQIIEYRLNNKEKTKAYRLKNKEKIYHKNKNRNRLYLQKNPDYYKEYKDKNRDSLRVKSAIYMKKRRTNDLDFYLRGVVRKRIHNALKAKGIRKNNSTIDLLGCSIADLKKHIESQFTEGMTWDKFGLHGIHLDHIAPLSSFDLTDEKQLRKASNYKNIQPLWAKDNLKKSNKINWEPNK